MRGARGTGSDGARALATVCETVDAAEFSVDHLGKGKGIPPVPELLQRGYLYGVTHSGGHEAIQWGLRAIVAAREPGAAPDLAHELHRRLKEIHHQPEFVAIELIDGVQGWRRVIAVPPQQLADVRPYLKALRRSSSVLRSCFLFGHDAVELVTVRASRLPVPLTSVPVTSESYLRHDFWHEDVPKACRNQFSEPRRLRTHARLRLRGRCRLPPRFAV